MAKNSEQTNENISKDQRRKNRKTGFYYSSLTLILVFCLIQIGYGAILNISNIISYQGKLLTLENLLKQAKTQNEDLKAEKKMITSDNSLEGIARNNLKMAGKDEVLIIINKKVETPVKQEKKWYQKLMDKFDPKSKSKQENNFEMPNIPQTMNEE